MHSVLKGPMLVLTVGLLMLTAHAQEGANPESQVSTVLLQTDHSWDNVKYGSYPAGQTELTVVKIKIPPHTALPWHTHPMPNAAYVLSGTLHVETKDGKHHITLHPGDVLPEMVGTVHRGSTDDAAVELIVFYAGVTNMPTAVKAP